MEERTYYSLSSSQKIMFLARQYTIHKAVTNIATSLIVNEKLKVKALEEAMRKGIERWDSFGIRLVKKGKETKQYIGKRECLFIVRKDFSGSTNEDMERFFYQEAKKKMKIMDCPLAKFYLVTTPGGDVGIFSIISHLIMDSWAISMLYKDIMEIYAALADGAPMPKDVKSFESTLLKEQEYAASDRYKRDFEFWKNEFSQPEPYYTHVNGSAVLDKYRQKRGKSAVRYGPGLYLRTRAAIEIQTIERDDVEKMKAFLIQYSLPTMQTLFLMGFRMYLAKVNGQQEDVEILNLCARRGTIEEKYSGGTRVHGLPFRTIMKDDMTFLDAVNSLMDRQNLIYKHADFGTMDIIKLESSMLPANFYEGYRSTCITFQPVSMSIASGARCETKWYSNGAAAQSFYLTVMDGDGTGNLRCYYEYMCNHVKRETVIDCHKFIHKVMMEGVKNPQMTLADIYKLD